jgi:hypothetical protein
MKKIALFKNILPSLQSNETPLANGSFIAENDFAPIANDCLRLKRPFYEGKTIIFRLYEIFPFLGRSGS